MAADDPQDLTLWGLIASLVLSVLANVGAGIKYMIDRRDLQTKSDADRVDRAHAELVTELRDRVEDMQGALEQIRQAHHDCEQKYSRLMGRIEALEAKGNQ